MLDKYDSLVTKNLLEVNKVNSKSPRIGNTDYTINCSFDKFGELTKCLKSVDRNTPISIDLYDEELWDKNTNCMDKYNLLETLNSFNYLTNIILELSDSAIFYYNRMMKNMNWKFKDKTTIKISIDRDPFSMKKTNLDLANIQGKLLNYKEEKLIWQPYDVINSLKGIVPDSTIHDAHCLKDVVMDFYNEVYKNYQYEKLNDYNKVIIAHQYIRKNISFALEQTKQENGKQKLKFHADKWVSHPYGTWVHKRGVCKGQARLMRTLLNNSLMQVNATTINGTTPRGEHCWVGVVIDDYLYHCCTTMAGPFFSVLKNGYVIDNDLEMNSIIKIYPSRFIKPEGREYIERHTKSLKRTRSPHHA